MADSTTTNLALVQPEVGASTDTWGNKLNADLGTIDAMWASTPAALTIAWGGTGGTTATAARTNLGCGTMSTQNANAVAITGGTIDNTTIGATTAPVVHVSTLIFPDATTQVSAAVTYTVGFQNVSASTTLTPTVEELLVYVNAGAGPVTVTLFSPANRGRKVSVKKWDGSANPVTIATAAGIIDNVATVALFRAFDVLTMMADGGGTWFIV